MYVDKKRKRWPYVVLAGAVLIAAAVIIYQAARVSARDIQEESAVALKAAIERNALQCYVVEGTYPSSLDYLEENYGLQINRKDFFVTYEAFAPNLPPYVQVLVRP